MFGALERPVNPPEEMIDGIRYNTNNAVGGDPYSSLRYGSIGGAFKWFCLICKKPYDMPHGVNAAQCFRAHCPNDTCAIIYELISDYAFRELAPWELEEYWKGER